MAEVFISHIHEEEQVAKALVSFMEKELGGFTKVFLSSDQWQVYAGERWLDRIKQELAAAKIVVLLLSTESVKRPWVNFEAGAAWLTEKVIIPVCFGGLSKSTLPKPYSDLHAIDLEDNEHYYLIRSVHHHLSAGGSIAPLPCSDAEFAGVRRAIEAVNRGRS